MKSLHRRLIRYGVVGLATLALYLAIGQALHDRAEMFLQLTLPFAAAVAANYWLQRSWVFEDDRPVRVSLPKYAIMVVAGLAFNVAGLAALTPRMSLIWAQLASATLVVGSNTVLAFLWVFWKKRERTGSARP